MDFKESIITKIVAFENYKIEEVAEGYIKVSTVVTKQSLNYYGHAHGGYLFTLCDQISGMTVLTIGHDAVTLQSSMNYLKAANLGDTLMIEGKIIHNGRTTKVVEVSLTNQALQLVAKGTFTMFVTGIHEDKIKEKGESYDA